MSELLQTIKKLRSEAQSRLQHAEAGRFKLYATAPGGASIDATSEYLSALRRQLSELDAAVAAAETKRT